MKKLVISIIGLISYCSLMAQGEFDALRYCQTDINGTARFMSMAGAFGALGGDASSIGINPAGLGVYRSSELSFTTGLYNSSTSSNWLNGTSEEDRYRVPLNNFTFVINLGNKNKKKGLVSSNFAFSFNKLKNFYRNTYIRANDGNSTSLTDYIANFTNGINYNDLILDNNYDPYKNTNIPFLSVLGYETWLIDTIPGHTDQYQSILNSGETVTPAYSISEEGYLNEWNFAYGANISNILFFGASLGVQSLDYSCTKDYQENFADGGGFLLSSKFYSSGTGYNFKFGAIVKPINELRIGASIQTPTFFDLTDSYSSSASSNVNGNSYSSTPIIDSYYQLEGPMVYNLSFAAVMGKVGILSFDYSLADYESMKLRDESGSSFGFSAVNTGMSQYLKASQTFKVGAEIIVTKEVSLRGGYAMTTNATEDYAIKEMPLNTTRTDTEYFLDNGSQYFTGGIGYREKNWFFDFAYMRKVQEEVFFPYTMANSESADVTTTTNNFVATLGFKF